MILVHCYKKKKNSYTKILKYDYISEILPTRGPHFKFFRAEITVLALLFPYCNGRDMHDVLVFGQHLHE